MAKHKDKFWADAPHQLRLYVIANLAVAIAGLADRFIFGHPYALEMTTIFVILINGFALWQQRSDLDKAYWLDEMIEKEEAEREAARDARLKQLGLK
jgi:hypothetical protein